MWARLVVIMLGLTCQFSLSYAGNYQPWSDKVFQHVKTTYGEQAEKRMRSLHKLILDNQDKSDVEKLTLVNNALNQFPWIADSIHWKKADYWATPLETITTFGGDCEDIAIVKWVVLRHLGIPREHLRLAYVKIKNTQQAHMVLVYVNKPQLPPSQKTIYILDNNEPEVMTLPKRKDLLFVYATDAEGTIRLIADNRGTPIVKQVIKGQRMRKLHDLIKKINDTREQLKTINDGRPLLPE